ncbi:MAG TPA: hypothetical protein VK988_15245 [Acidimicrobiales bacterium]|nr:hypothetical protein [Acidimicrobiales bacterium]
MVSIPSQPTTFEEFVQRVRRHRVTDVLDAVAVASVALTNAEFGHGPAPEFASSVQPWSLAAVAKAAVVSGNDHRDKVVTVGDLTDMCSLFVNVEDPILSTVPGADHLSSFLVRIAYEQFPSQLSVFEELARTEALLGDAAGRVEQSVINQAFWEAALGCSLVDFVGLGLLLNIGALCNAGYYDPGWLAQPNFRAVTAVLPRHLIERVAQRHFLASRGDFRRTAMQHRLQDRYLRRFEFNPLVVHPFIEQPDGRFVSPIPRYALTRATPTGLYYIGLKHGGKAFTDALGSVFEDYVGSHLALLAPEQLLHDVEYRRGHRTADWIVVLPRAVLVVEAKATPLSEAARLGGERLGPDLQRAPGKAIRQIERTAELIKSGHAALGVPRDRPIIGLVATLEPYFQCNSDLVWRRDAGAVPVLLASSRELENLVAISERGVDDLLLEVTARGELGQWNLGRAIAESNLGRNPILDRAWDTYPFRESNAEVA